MKNRQLALLGLVALTLLACSLLSRTPTPGEGDSIDRPGRSTLSLRQAWQLAWPEVEAWAADAQPTQRWSCLGTVSEDGTCRQWEGLVVSAEQGRVAGVTVATNRVLARPSDVAQLGPPAIEAAFERQAVMDSTQAAQVGWEWLESQGLRTESTRLTGLSLRSGPGSVECGEAPTYSLVFESPPGSLCLDGRSGAVLYNDYAP